MSRECWGRGNSATLWLGELGAVGEPEEHGWERSAGGPRFRFKLSVAKRERRQHEQIKQGRCGEPAENDNRHRPFGFYVLTSDGVLHTVADGSGVDLQAPVKFLGANAHASNLIAIPEDNDKWHSYVVYTATSDNCGGVKNGVWAINLADDAKPIAHFETGASPVGDPAFSTDGTVFVAVGKGPAGSAYSNAIVALAPKSLTVKDWFTAPNADFTSGPTVIKHGDKELVAAATKDGRIYLLDAASLGGSDHKTAMFVSPAYSTAKTDYAPQALAAWQDADHVDWILEPFAGAGPGGVSSNGKVTNGGLVALKLTDDGAKVALTPGWVSQDMISPLPPVAVNGVVFAASSGEYYPAAGKSV